MYHGPSGTSGFDCTQTRSRLRSSKPGDYSHNESKQIDSLCRNLTIAAPEVKKDFALRVTKLVNYTFLMQAGEISTILYSQLRYRNPESGE